MDGLELSSYFEYFKKPSDSRTLVISNLADFPSSFICSGQKQVYKKKQKAELMWACCFRLWRGDQQLNRQTNVKSHVCWYEDLRNQKNALKFVIL